MKSAATPRGMTSIEAGFAHGGSGWIGSRTAAGGRAWALGPPIPKPVRWAFLLFVASIPLQSVVVPGLPSVMSVPNVAGLAFFGCCLAYPRTCFRRPAPAVLCFVGYLAIFVIDAFFTPEELRLEVRARFRTMVQLVVFFWVSSSLLQNVRLRRQILFTFGAASAVFAVGTIFKVPGIADKFSAGGRLAGTRATALNMNPNALAAVMAVGALMLIGLLLDNTKRSRVEAWCLAGMIVPILVVIVSTSSRAGLLSFVAGVSLFLVPLTPSRRRVAAFALGSLALMALVIMIARDPVSSLRWTQTLREGSITGRDTIWSQGIPMFGERPILGWGPMELFYELGSRLGLPIRDPQNLVLFLLLEVGIVGASFFFAGFWFCGRAAWRSRMGPEGVLPLALLVAVAVKEMSGVGIAMKHTWLVLAIALASRVAGKAWQRKASRRPLPLTPMDRREALEGRRIE
jgi:O-antigen ligase